MSNIFRIGQSKAKKIKKEDVNVTYADVAGCDEAKKEVMEFVEFLKEPDRFTKLGVRSRRPTSVPSTRGHRTMPWVFSCSILTGMLRAGLLRGGRARVADRVQKSAEVHVVLLSRGRLFTSF